MTNALQRNLARLSIAAFVALSGCSGSSTLSPPPTAGNVTGGTPGAGLTSRIVGVGDSLTAGFQSNDLMGADIIPNPIGGSLLPFIPNTQGHGFYALVWSQANGGANPLSAATSPLPLILPPGVGQFIVPLAAGGTTSLQTACGGLNAAAFSTGSAQATRINPGTSPLDVAVPGMTLHEAIAMYQPLGPCDGSSLPSPFNGLNKVVGSESLYFNPILGSFGTGVTQLQAAVRLRPTLATVWLGSNDLLHFLGSNGGFPPPTPASFEADTVTVITTLQKAGAKVVVANLVDVLSAAYFTPQPFIPTALTAQLQQSPFNLPASLAAELGPVFGAWTQAFIAPLGVTAGGYLTLTGYGKVGAAMGATLQQTQPGQLPSQAVFDAALTAAGLTTGDYVSDTIAGAGQQLNNAYNAAIAAAAQQTGAPLIDVHAFVANIYAQPNHYYPLPSNPKCCSMLYGGGFFSLDGIHPSNTGYALVANLFIQGIDTLAPANSIPPLSGSQIATINATDIYSPH
jgi:lysophospholipase L1-like esterase